MAQRDGRSVGRERDLKTVEAHLANIFRKLGISKRAAVARALDRAAERARRAADRGHLVLVTWALTDPPLGVEALPLA